ncbi:hypothetical protein ABK040_002204 [Willaertia magna]
MNKREGSASSKVSDISNVSGGGNAGTSANSANSNDNNNNRIIKLGSSIASSLDSSFSFTTTISNYNDNNNNNNNNAMIVLEDDINSEEHYFLNHLNHHHTTTSDKNNNNNTNNNQNNTTKIINTTNTNHTNNNKPSTITNTASTTTTTNTTINTSNKNSTTTNNNTTNTTTNTNIDQSLNIDILLPEIFSSETLQLYHSSKWQDREQFLIQLQTWIQQSSNLPHGYMIFPTLTLPIEKSKILFTLSTILKKLLNDKIIKIIQLSFGVCNILMEASPVVQAKNILYLREGFSQLLIPILMEKVMDGSVNEKVRMSAINVLLKMSCVKVCTKMVMNFALQSLQQSINGSGDGNIKKKNVILSPKAIQGRLILIELLIKKHENLFDLKNKLIEIINETIIHKTLQIRESCNSLLITIYSIKKLHFLFDDLKHLNLLQKLEKQMKEKEIILKNKNEIKKESVVTFLEGDITKELILKKSLKNCKNLNLFFKKLTHLNLNNCNINEIINLENLINLRVLYLYNNKIKIIKNLNKNINLIHLYLHHNLIEKIEGLNNLLNLEKLYLNNNKIKYLENLNHLKNLKELYLQNQNINEFKILDSLQNLQNLNILDLSNNHMNEIINIKDLNNLNILDLSKNNLQNLNEILFILENNKFLNNLNLLNNPICNDYKFRDFIILNSSIELNILNNLEITNYQREFLISKNKFLKHSKNSEVEDKVLMTEE